ncbi:MAG: permease [Peptococcaceae bacterium]|nr:permease [Peptococcaceae bacterium]
MFNVILFTLTLAALIYSFIKDRQKTRQALKIAYNSFRNILPSMLGIIGLIGLMLALVPKETIEGLFGNNSPAGILIISAVGSVTLIPAFIAFPLAASLLQAGASIMAVSIFITTLLMVGVLTAPMEIQYFGKKFTILRNVFSLAAALGIAVIMGVALQ